MPEEPETTVTVQNEPDGIQIAMYNVLLGIEIRKEAPSRYKVYVNGQLSYEVSMNNLSASLNRLNLQSQPYKLNTAQCVAVYRQCMLDHQKAWTHP